MIIGTASFGTLLDSVEWVASLHVSHGPKSKSTNQGIRIWRNFEVTFSVLHAEGMYISCGS